MTRVSQLVIQDFSKPFTVETDACRTGVGVVLSQEGKPLAFLSKALPTSKCGLCTYKKELWAIIFVVNKWRYYLYGRPFFIQTDFRVSSLLLIRKFLLFSNKSGSPNCLGMSTRLHTKKAPKM